jgi:hypothetical protein
MVQRPAGGLPLVGTEPVSEAEAMASQIWARVTLASRQLVTENYSGGGMTSFVPMRSTRGSLRLLNA